MAVKRLLLSVGFIVACAPTYPVAGGDEGGEETGGPDPSSESSGGASSSGAADTGSSSGGSEEESSSGESTGFVETDTDTDGEIIECSMFEQDCPDGQKCMPYANDGGNTWNATMCVPIAEDPAQLDEPCTVEESGVSGVDTCDLGLMCWDVDPATLQGECIAMCRGDESEPECPDPTDWCSISGDGILTLCLGTCDPLGSDCDADEVCVPVSSRFVCTTNAAPKGAGNDGDPCEYTNVCNPGLVCLGAEFVPGCEGDTGCCAAYCDLAAPDCDGTSCLPWFDEGQAPEELDHVGVCGVDPE